MRMSEIRTSEEPCRANPPAQACPFSAMVQITPDSVRMRARRNAIEHDKDENSRQFVYIDESELVRNEAQDMSTNACIDSLKSEVELLLNELEGQRELLSRELEDWKEEARRKDAIIMSLTYRTPQLEAPRESAPEPRESPVSASEEGRVRTRRG